MVRLAAASAGITPTGCLHADLPGTVHLDILQQADAPALR